MASKYNCQLKRLVGPVDAIRSNTQRVTIYNYVLLSSSITYSHKLSKRIVSTSKLILSVSIDLRLTTRENKDKTMILLPSVYEKKNQQTRVDDII